VCHEGSFVGLCVEELKYLRVVVTILPPWLTQQFIIHFDLHDLEDEFKMEVSLSLGTCTSDAPTMQIW